MIRIRDTDISRNGKIRWRKIGVNPNTITSLDVRCCMLLKSLPCLPRCVILCCHSCPLLKSIISLPRCVVLNCCDCPLLKSLPSLPCCTVLFCDAHHAKYFEVGDDANKNARACQEYQMLMAWSSPRVIRRLRSPLCRVHRLPPELVRMLKEFLI